MSRKDGNLRPDSHRRKWDRDEYEKLAQERVREEEEEEEAMAGTSKAGAKRKSSDDAFDNLDEDWAEMFRPGGSKQREPPVKRALLKRRDYKIDLDSKLGKSVVITKNTPSAQAGGYYCNVCDCVVKDSINFLDHINGKKHQRNLGMSMKVERSTVDQVKARFSLNKKKVEEKKKDYDLEQRVAELREEEEKLREYRREKRKEKKGGIETSGSGFDSDMAAVMGFSGFGTSSKKN